MNQLLKFKNGTEFPFCANFLEKSENIGLWMLLQIKNIF